MITMICMMALLALVSMIGSRLIFRSSGAVMPSSFDYTRPLVANNGTGSNSGTGSNNGAGSSRGVIVDLNTLLTPYDVHRRNWLIRHGVPDHLHARTDTGIAAMQLLGEVHEYLEVGIGTLDVNDDPISAASVRRRWETIKLGLQFHDFDGALLDDLEQHMMLVETGLNAWGSLLLDADTVSAGTAARLASDVSNRSPVLVVRIAAELEPESRTHLG